MYAWCISIRFPCDVLNYVGMAAVVAGLYTHCHVSCSLACVGLAVAHGCTCDGATSSMRYEAMMYHVDAVCMQ